jgi:hypothetical protein
MRPKFQFLEQYFSIEFKERSNWAKGDSIIWKYSNLHVRSE